MPVYRDKNGTWYVMCRYTDWRGERKQKCKRGLRTKRDAQAWEREFLMQKQADVNMTFASFVQLYERDVKSKLKLNTWLSKESVIQKKLLPYFGQRRLSEITAKDVLAWQNEMQDYLEMFYGAGTTDRIFPVSKPETRDGTRLQGYRRQADQDT